MSYATEANAIRSRFNTEWKAVQGFSTAEMQTRVAWPNKTFKPPNGLSWTRLSILSADSDQIEIAPTGSRNFRHDGVVSVQVFVPANTGDTAARTLAEQVCVIFRGVTAGGVTYLSPYVTEIGQDGSGWYGLTVWCPYYRDTQF